MKLPGKVNLKLSAMFHDVQYFVSSGVLGIFLLHNPLPLPTLNSVSRAPIGCKGLRVAVVGAYMHT
jgi:hypothetical protein